jgi:Helix-turn-helix domain
MNALDAREWLKVPMACEQSGLSRSLIYELIAEGAIRSACIKRRHAKKGMRLIHRRSLLAYIESFAQGAHNERANSNRTGSKTKSPAGLGGRCGTDFAYANQDWLRFPRAWARTPSTPGTLDARACSDQAVGH